MAQEMLKEKVNNERRITDLKACLAQSVPKPWHNRHS